MFYNIFPYGKRNQSASSISGTAWSNNINDTLHLEGNASLNAKTGSSVMIVNPELMDTKRYTAIINLDQLSLYDNIDFVKGDRVLVSLDVDDTIFKIENAKINTYGDVSKFITDNNSTEVYTKQSTEVTNNTLSMNSVTMDMDGAVYYLRSNYGNSDDLYYSDSITLDVKELESVTATFFPIILHFIYFSPSWIKDLSTFCRFLHLQLYYSG